MIKFLKYTGNVIFIAGIVSVIFTTLSSILNFGIIWYIASLSVAIQSCVKIYFFRIFLSVSLSLTGAFFANLELEY